MSEHERHWQSVYRDRTDEQLSWWRERSGLSRVLIEAELDERGRTPVPARVLDVGGGESTLGVEIAARGCDVTVLDVSAAALERGQQRARALDPSVAQNIRWIAADVTAVAAETIGTIDLWHDRAVFHFLTRARDQERYAALLENVLSPGGIAIIGTFALDGPESCSGLPVVRRDPAGIADAIGPSVELTGSHREVHTTPWNSAQPFSYAVLRRR